MEILLFSCTLNIKNIAKFSWLYRNAVSFGTENIYWYFEFQYHILILTTFKQECIDAIENT